MHCKTAAFAILIMICLLVTAVSTCSAGTYSITQTSNYTISTSGSMFEHMVPVHIDLSDWTNPDLKKTKENMDRAGWRLRFHHDSDTTTLDDFKNEVDKSDIHFHAGHGLNLLLYGGHMELKNHPLPSAAVTANDLKGKLNQCKWFVIHSCHVLEDMSWTGVLKGSNTHGIFGFGSMAYTTGHFLADFSDLITHDMPLAKAWQKASIDNMNEQGDNIIIARSFFKNEAQCVRDRLNNASPINNEDIVVCDMEIGDRKRSWVVKMTALKTGKTLEWKMEREDFQNTMNFPIEKAKVYYDWNKKMDL